MKKKQNKTFTSLSVKDRWIMSSLLILLLGLIVFSDFYLHRKASDLIDKQILGLQAGEISQKDLTAEEDVFYIDTRSTEALQQEAVNAVPPVFRISLIRSINALEELNGIKSIIMSQTQEIDEKIEAIEQAGYDRLFTGDDLARILDYDGQQLQFLFSLIEELLIEIFEEGIYASEDLEAAGQPDQIRLISFSSTGESSSLIVPVQSLLTLQGLPQYMENELASSAGSLIDDIKTTASQLIKALAVENVMYDSITTEIVRTEAKQSIVPVIKNIEKGEIILQAGFVVTEEALEKLQAMEQVEVSQSLQERIGRSLYYLVILMFAAFIIYRLIPQSQRKRQLLYIMISFMIVYQLLYFLLVIQLFSRNISTTAVFTPILLFSMLFSIIYDRKTASAFTAFAAAVSYFIPSMTLAEMFFILAQGICGVFVVYDSRKRIDLIRSTGIMIGVSMLLSLGIGLVDVESVDWFSRYILTAGIVSMFAGIGVVVALPILEHVFNLPTSFRLVELTTMNSKVLKRMAVMARGTYSHSVAVADLAESACEAIGANHLLARVGAYYHDIGKIDQPEYFIENQTGDNKHDELKPSLSVVVIKSHVKVGIEKAKAIGLPQEVIDIIEQHHGSDVISYFYREALMKNDRNNKISPEDFSYSGSPPMSKEAAVVMIADSVDAASRTLKQPTTTKLEKLIWKIIMDKIDHQQLKFSDLSIKELEMIKNSFVLNLSGRYHTRIAYPEIPNGDKK